MRSSGRIRIRKGVDTANVENATVSQSYGNYIIVDEYKDIFFFSVEYSEDLDDSEDC